VGVKRTLGTAFSTLLLLAGLVAVAAPAQAANVACGQTILASTVLDGDVGPCNTGITIGANNVTFDLGGHTIRGNPSPAEGEGPGITLVGRTGVTVKNGVVRDFDAGVYITGGSANTVTGMKLLDNLGSGETDFGDGLLIDNSSNNTVRGNQIVHNGPYDGVGVIGASSSGNVIDGNEIANNNLANIRHLHGDVNGTQDDHGVRLEPRVSGNTVTNNRVTGNGLDGISVFPRATNNVVRNNFVFGNGFTNLDQRKGDGIDVFQLATNNVVQGNQVFNNAANGIFVGAAATGNQILGNRTGNNNQQPQGTPDFDLRDDNLNPPCDANAWHANTFGTFNQPCVTAP
jgi:parallel beta-helix repeat protein